MAEQATDGSKSPSVDSKASSTIGWRSLLAPLWQSSGAGVPQSYQELVERGRSLQGSHGTILQKMVWWSEDWDHKFYPHLHSHPRGFPD
eukprot:3029905-Amphidinium_carterae.1